MAISIKGILVGVVFGFVMSLIAGAVMGIVAAAMFGAEGVESLVGTSPGRMTAPVFFIGAIVSVAAGYVAARVAGRGELINAVLSNLIGAGISAFMTMAMSPDALVDSLVMLAAAPLFGSLGGYLRLRQVAGLA
jgi:hypothetical protein